MSISVTGCIKTYFWMAMCVTMSVVFIVIYGSLLLGQTRALVNESKDIGDRKDAESTKEIWVSILDSSSESVFGSLQY